MEERDKKYLREAIALAGKNAEEAHGGPFGAVIVKNNEVIAATSNSVTVDNDPTAHAEVNAIRESAARLKTFDLSGCTLYSSCEPCPMCLSAAYWANIDKIIYAADKNDAAKAGFDDDFIYKELAKPVKDRKLITENMLHEEGVVPFEIWIKNEDKIPY